MTRSVCSRNGSAKRVVWGGVLALLFGLVPLYGQAVRPVIVQYKGDRVRGKFEVVNDSLLPLNAVIEARSFRVSEEGDLTFQPLDRNIRVKLSDMAARLSPQQSHLVFYEARAETLPAWFVIYSTVARNPAPSGLTVQVQLPHVVYLAQEEPLRDPDVDVLETGFDSRTGQVALVLENTSPRLGRLLEITLVSQDNKKTFGGFPLFPKYRRHVALEWGAEQRPEKIVLRFEHFRVEKPVSDSLVAKR